MSQVRLLSVDVSQSPDIHSGKGEAANKNQAKGSAFSDAMEQHYPSKKIIESDSDAKPNGNLVSKAATSYGQANNHDSLKQAKASKTDDAHTLPVPLPIDDDALAGKLFTKLKTSGDAHTLPVPLPVDDDALAGKLFTKLKTSDDAHTLPVPLPVDDEALAGKLFTKLKTSDDAHILPVPLPVDDEALAGKLITKLTVSDDAHTLPVPLPVDDEALAGKLITKLTASGDAHTLPVPLPIDDEALAGKLFTKLTASDSAHTLPVPSSPEGEKLTAITRAKDDAHILPVPITPSSSENKTASSLDKNRVNDDTVDLLKMLNGAQKLLLKTNVEQLPLSASAGDGQAAKSLVESESTVKSVTDKLAGLGTALDAKQITTTAAAANSLVIEQTLNDEQIVKQINAQAFIQESKFAIDNNHHAMSAQANSELKTPRSAGDNDPELIMSKNAVSTKLSAENKGLTSASDNAKVQDENQANIAGFKSVIGDEQRQTRAINQSTVSVVTTPTADSSRDASQKVAINEASNKSASSDVELDKLASTESEKKIQPAEKTPSIFNQTLDAQGVKPMLSASELAARQEQSFESAINKLTTDTVQTQKSITAINTETIAIYRKDFANAVKDKVMVMINQKIQQVEIQLDPPEMGNIHVRVNLQNEQAAVQFIVQNQQAKDALEQNMGKLRDMLAENGVDVGDANIEQREAKEQNSQGFDGQADNSQHGESGDDINNENDNSVLNLVKASSTGVDYYA